MKKTFLDLVKISGTYSFGNFAQKAVAVFLIPLYTSYLTPEDYGILALVVLAATVLTKLVSSPITYALGRFYYKSEYQDRRGVLLFNLIVLLLIQSFLLSLIYWHLTETASWLLFDSQTYIRIVELFTWIVFLTPWSTVNLYYLQIRKMARYYVLISIGNLLIMVIGNVYFLVFLNLGLYSLVYTQIISAVFTVVMTIPVYLKETTFRLSFKILKEPLKFGYPQIPSGYSFLVLESGDRYILKLLATVNSVGLYSFGVQIASILGALVVMPIGKGLEPIIFEMEDRPQEQKRFLVRMATLYYLIGIFLALLLSVFAQEILTLLVRNEGFMKATAILPILAFALIQFGLGYFLGWGLVMKDKPYHISMNLILTAGLNVVLNFLLIPALGIVGAALATLVSYIFWNFIRMYHSAKFYELHFELSRLMHVSVIGIGLYCLTFLIPANSNFFVAFGIKILLCLAYFPAFFLTGFFENDEQRLIKGAVKSLRKGEFRKLLINFGRQNSGPT